MEKQHTPPFDFKNKVEMGLKSVYKGHYLYTEMIAIAGIVWGIMLLKVANIYSGIVILDYIFRLIRMISSSFVIVSLLFIILMFKPLLFLHKYIQLNQETLLIPLLNQACYKLSYFNLLLIFKASVVLGMFLAYCIHYLVSVNLLVYFVLSSLLLLKSLLFLSKNKSRALK